jgi:hypothetical protein
MLWFPAAVFALQIPPNDGEVSAPALWALLDVLPMGDTFEIILTTLCLARLSIPVAFPLRTQQLFFDLHQLGYLRLDLIPELMVIAGCFVLIAQSL